MADAFAEELITFWFGAAAGWDRATAPVPDAVDARWWNGGEELDLLLTEKYAPHLLAAAQLFEAEKARALEVDEGRTDAQRRLLNAEAEYTARAVPLPQLEGDESGGSAAASAAAIVRDLALPFLQFEEGQPADIDTVRRRLALVILLDQFSRNVYRNTPQAFAFDRYSGPLVTQLISEAAALGCRASLISGADRLAVFERFFLLMPLEHSEIPAEQDLGVQLNRGLLDEVSPVNASYGGPEDVKEDGTVEYFEDTLRNKSARAELIRIYGRYPPRNEVLWV